jgi:hypothetical protein
MDPRGRSTESGGGGRPIPRRPGPGGLKGRSSESVNPGRSDPSLRSGRRDSSGSPRRRRRLERQVETSVGGFAPPDPGDSVQRIASDRLLRVIPWGPPRPRARDGIARDDQAGRIRTFSRRRIDDAAAFRSAELTAPIRGPDASPSVEEMETAGPRRGVEVRRARRAALVAALPTVPGASSSRGRAPYPPRRSTQRGLARRARRWAGSFGDVTGDCPERSERCASLAQGPGPARVAERPPPPPLATGDGPGRV